jgi:hypothetical protein
MYFLSVIFTLILIKILICISRPRNDSLTYREKSCLWDRLPPRQDNLEDNLLHWNWISRIVLGTRRAHFAYGCTKNLFLFCQQNSFSRGCIQNLIVISCIAKIVYHVKTLIKCTQKTNTKNIFFLIPKRCKTLDTQINVVALYADYFVNVYKALPIVFLNWVKNVLISENYEFSENNFTTYFLKKTLNKKM